MFVVVVFVGVYVCYIGVIVFELKWIWDCLLEYGVDIRLVIEIDVDLVQVIIFVVEDGENVILLYIGVNGVIFEDYVK